MRSNGRGGGILGRKMGPEWAQIGSPNGPVRGRPEERKHNDSKGFRSKSALRGSILGPFWAEKVPWQFGGQVAVNLSGRHFNSKKLTAFN